MKKNKEFTDLNLSNLDNLLFFIKKENEKQIKKWGVQTHDTIVWNTILNEEVGELTKEMLEIYIDDSGEANRHYKSAFHEAIQVATLSLKIAEMLFAKLSFPKSPSLGRNS